MALLLGIAALLCAGGLQTIWAPPETMTATVGQQPAEAPLTVITSGIDAVDEAPVEYTISGEGSFTVMLGRERDVQAWVGDAAHNTVTGITTDVPGGEAPRIEVEHAEGEATVPDPKGSDLWLDVQEGKDRLEQRWSVPSDGDWALLVARDGTDPAPTEMTVTWTNRVGDNPWIVPLYVIGGLLVLIGIGLLAWAAARRARGPRDGAGTPVAPGAGAASPPSGAASSGTGSTAGTVTSTSGAAVPGPSGGPATRRALRAIGAGVTALAIGLTGVAPAGAAPAATAEASSPAATEEAGDEAYSVLTDAQLERILGKVAQTVRAGDLAQNATKLRPRVAEHALEMRSLNYRNRKIDDSIPAPEPIGSSPVLSAAAVSDPSFPRTAMAITEGKGNSTPQILMLRQESARGQYRLVATAPMTPGAQLPAGSLDQTGVEVLESADAEGLMMAPGHAVAGTARYLSDAGDDFSESIEANPYVDAVHEYQESLVEGADDARFTFRRESVPDSVVGLRLADGSAIVLGNLYARTYARPKEAGGAVIVDELAAELRGGGRVTHKGVRMTYREVLALHVPAAGASGEDARISLVGMADELRTVKFLS
ncbi:MULTISPECIES: hypothetical protein [Micrococcaceae]|uniref:hypothetical protein n=1 Tax=Micrococcaceae TaxID=1268 RepID=UPI00160957A5|nr:MULTISPECIES: hypothetical protein [Micrococcaceae]MBB5748381.1 hypothetical protein [Micrococcus sp. TA1]HRO93509.1 hypothetical protein [Citricoccus sp.]